MNYRKQIIGLLLLLLSCLIIGFFLVFSRESQYCSSLYECGRILIFGAPYQYFILPILGYFFSLIPLLFLKQAVYYTWRKFALWALPIIALVIITAPVYPQGNFFTFGYDREVVAMYSSALFLIISYLLILTKALKERKQ